MNSAVLPACETTVLPEIDIENAQDEVLDSDVPWNVVLLDDDFHSYDYVIEMLMNIFGYPIRKAFQMTVEVDTRKRVIVWSGHLERAEAYQAQIHDYGADPRMEISKGSMSAILERAR
ncbi:MAG TPA: ATP-dependent Clp protease adaptor ClpS [Abditibacterium sp.]